MGFLSVFENFLLISYEKYFHYPSFSMPVLIHGLGKTAKVDTYFIANVKKSVVSNIQSYLILKMLVHIKLHGVEVLFMRNLFVFILDV
jgi:hypothetical protein